MGNLLVSLLNSASAMKLYDRQLETLQNNVTNASTPGYVRQTQTSDALPFQLDQGLPGGVRPGPVVSARNAFAEETVRRAQSDLGQAGQKATDLAQLETLFDPAAAYGIAGSLNKFFQGFAQLSINPNDQVARQSVIDRSGALAQSINQSAIALGDQSSNLDHQVGTTVGAINRLAGDIRDLNATRRQNAASSIDAGLDARVHSTLEELSQYANFSALQQTDGTFSIYLGGQTALVIGEHIYPVQTDFSTAITKVRDATGIDIGGQIQSGKLAALLEEKNQIVPSYLTDLNTLARTLSDQVNAQLGAGLDRSGSTPVIDLFSYNATVGEAISLGVTGITPDQIAAASPGAPGGNGNALDIAAMVDGKLINGFTLSKFYGSLGGRVGADVALAKEQQSSRTSAVNQARSLRDQVSSVSLDDEAAHLIQIQRAYQASGKLMTVLNELTGTLISLIN